MHYKNLSKTLSALLAVLVLTNPVSSVLPKTFAANTRSLNKAIDKNHKVDEKNTCNKIIDHVQNHLAAYSTGAVLTIGSLIWYFGHSKDNVPAEQWFTCLGGTQGDISNYHSRCNENQSDIETCYNFFKTGNENDQISDSSKKLVEALSKDANRTFFAWQQRTLSLGKDEPHNFHFFRIAYLYYTNQVGWQNQIGGGYTQGESDLLGAIYQKFLLWHPELADPNYDEPTTLVLEAKIYYVFSEFMRVLKCKNFIDPDYIKDSNLNGEIYYRCNKYICNLLEQSTDCPENLRSMLSKLKEYNPDKDNPPHIPPNFDILCSCTFGALRTLDIRVFEFEHWVSMMDSIIMNNNSFLNGKLNYEKVLAQIGNIAISELLKQKEFRGENLLH